MAVERGEIHEAKVVLVQELKKLNVNPEEVLKKAEEGLARFMDQKDTSFWDEYLDKPENIKVSDILTKEREELGGSIIAIMRRDLERRRRTS